MGHKITKYDLCSACRKIRPLMNDGSLGSSIEDYLDSVGYSNPLARPVMNRAVLTYLRDDGGCSDCMSLVGRAI